jgi:hypothetical protein
MDEFFTLGTFIALHVLNSKKACFIILWIYGVEKFEVTMEEK